MPTERCLRRAFRSPHESLLSLTIALFLSPCPAAVARILPTVSPSSGHLCCIHPSDCHCLPSTAFFFWLITTVPWAAN